jgi:acyl-ACP thioesterase
MPVPEDHPNVFDREWPLRVADIDRNGRRRLDAAARHIQDIGQDQLRELGFEDVDRLRWKAYLKAAPGGCDTS